MARAHWILLSLVLSLLACLSASPVRAELPTPSPYPVSWELKFDYRKPTRVVVTVPGKALPDAYWYVPFVVTNTTGQEQLFLPIFQLVTKEGEIIRSDKNISPSVIAAIKQREGDKFMQDAIFTSGEIRLGAEEARHGVAVWPEPMQDMGRFSILVGGLSGEYKKVTDAKGTATILRKTLQLNYLANGASVQPDKQDEKLWIMH